MALIDPKPIQRPTLEKMCGGDQRAVKSIEKLFELIPSQLNINQDALEAAQIAADNAGAQAFLAVALIQAVNQLAEMKALEPTQACSCQSFEDLAPRYETVQQDVILPSTQPVDPINLNLEVT